MTAVDPGDPREGLPPPWRVSLLDGIRAEGGRRTAIVLDDDPTGTQTVRDVPVLVDPSLDDLGGLLAERTPLAFVLTNSRSLPERAAVALARKLGRRIATAARRAGRDVSVVSRSDSTLRGHFPAEVDAVAAAIGVPDAAVLLMPYLGDAGRITIGDVHYVARPGARPVPVADTEFARDAAFGFAESNLRDWAAARVARRDQDAMRPITSLSLELIRHGGPAAVAAALAELPARAICVANAADDRDAEVVAAAVLDVEEAGRAIVARTAAGYVRARAGQERTADLRPADLPVGRGTGLVVVGSHVPTTTRQLERLLDDPPAPVELIEVPAEAALDPRAAARIRRTTRQRAASLLAEGTIPIVATTRALVRGRADDAAGLAVASRVSRLLVSIVAPLVAAEPGWVLAKGGITSSEVATRALGARRATVLGQLLAGVPVWRVPGEGGSRLLVVFPGNVGADDALRTAVAALVAAGRR